MRQNKRLTEAILSRNAGMRSEFRVQDLISVHSTAKKLKPRYVCSLQPKWQPIAMFGEVSLECCPNRDANANEPTWIDDVEPMIGRWPQ
jgi:hypothetical protein